MSVILVVILVAAAAIGIGLYEGAMFLLRGLGAL